MLQWNFHLEGTDRSNPDGDHHWVGSDVVRDHGIFLTRIGSQHIEDLLTPWLDDVGFWDNGWNAANPIHLIRFSVFIWGHRGHGGQPVVIGFSCPQSVPKHKKSGDKLLIIEWPRTLENWEQGRARPNAQAALLIRLVERYPDTMERLAMMARAAQ